MKIKFSSICGVYDCSGAGVHYKIMQREEGAGERVFGKAHEQPFVDRITAQLRPAPHAFHCETRLKIGLSFQIRSADILSGWTFCQDRLTCFVRKTFCQDRPRRFVRTDLPWKFCQDRL